MDTLFNISNLLVLPFWLLMILAPHWSITKRVMKTYWVLVPAALLYSVLVLPDMFSLFGELASPSLDSVAMLLGNPAGATIGWIHFLAFDLFVGRWAYLDSRKHNISAWLASPALFFTLMLGPFGFLLYLVIRTIILKQRDT